MLQRVIVDSMVSSIHYPWNRWGRFISSSRVPSFWDKLKGVVVLQNFVKLFKPRDLRKKPHGITFFSSWPCLNGVTNESSLKRSPRSRHYNFRRWLYYISVNLLLTDSFSIAVVPREAVVRYSICDTDRLFTMTVFTLETDYSSETDKPSWKSVKIDRWTMDKVRRIVHQNLKPFHF